MNILNSGVLILNKSWFPVRISTFQRSLVKVCSDRGKFIDHDSFSIYDWDQWIEEFRIENSDLHKFDRKTYIKGVSFSVKRPKVFVCSSYNDIPNRDLKLTRRNLLVRDNFKCQYCGKTLSGSSATIDHVLPRSRGGVNSWPNLVISCINCNVGKGDKTPEEANLKLHKKPKKPSWSPMFYLAKKKWDKDWNKFVNTDKWNEMGYWDVELKG